MTAASKRQLIEGLVVGFERGKITILDDPVLINELEAYTAEAAPGGHERFGAPPGFHDDTVMACALAWSQIAGRVKRPKGSLPKPGMFSGLRKKSYVEERDGVPMARRTSVRSVSARLKNVHMLRSR